MDQISSALHGVGGNLKTTQPKNVWNGMNMQNMPELLKYESQYQQLLTLFLKLRYSEG